LKGPELRAVSRDETQVHWQQAAAMDKERKPDWEEI